MDEIRENELVEKEQESVENKKNCCGDCETVRQVRSELDKLAAENERLKEELEQMKKLPRFSAKTVAEKNSLEAVRSIFRKR